VGRAQATLTLVCEKERKYLSEDKWENPLFGLAKTKGAALTLDSFLVMQQDEIKRENENDQRLWCKK